MIAITAQSRLTDGGGGSTSCTELTRANTSQLLSLLKLCWDNTHTHTEGSLGMPTLLFRCVQTGVQKPTV